MAKPSPIVRTALAEIERLRSDLVEVRYQPGVTLNLGQMAEVQQARRELMGEHPYGMVTLLPEDVDFELPTLQVDHLAKDRKDGNLMATAVVAQANLIEMLVKLHFSYFPQLHRVLVTASETEARAWLEAQMKEVARTGS